MFKKLLSNLPYNPSLISQVGFYAKRLRAESSIRRMGVIMLVLSLLVQGFAIASPVKPVQASDNDMFPGGFANQAAAVNACNANSYNFKVILSYFSIHCEDLFFGTQRRINYGENGGNMYSMGRNPYGFASEVPVSIPGAGNFYMRRVQEWGPTCWDDGAGCQAVVGRRPNGTPFWVLLSCGNIVIYGPPQPPEALVVCNRLNMNYPNGATVQANTTISVRGFASGAGVPPGETATMIYEYVNADNGQVLETQQSDGIGFNGSEYQDPNHHKFVVTQNGNYLFRLAVKHKNGTKESAGNRAGECVKSIVVSTQPEKVILCDDLMMNVEDGSEVDKDTDVELRGQATGKNVNDGDPVDMYYEYVDASNGVVLGQAEAKNVQFNNATATDSEHRDFKLEQEGTFIFRLSVKYDGGQKNAVGNNEGNCVKQVTVPGENIDLELHKKVRNETKGIEDANGTKADPGDVLVYTLSVKNLSDSQTVEGYVVEESISDILEYANIEDYHGGVKNDRGIVKWPATDIKPGQTIEQKLTVKVKKNLPQTPVAPSNPGSYDLLMTNVYGDVINVELPPSPPKRLETITTEQLPNTGPGETMAAAFTVTLVAGYFFARSKLMSKELAIVKEEVAAGGSQ